MRQRNKNTISLAEALDASYAWADPGALDSTAATVIEVIPAVMDTMRTSLRSHVGDQLTVPQFRCLAFISRHGGTTVTEVSSFMGVTKATASVMIDRLMRAGAILVVSDSADRRRSLLHISSAGRTQMQSIRNEARKDFAQAMSSLSKQELDTLNEGLEILRKTFRRERMPVRDMSITN
jgi:DNA-binding MarR family transcriptional regulator